MSGQGVGLGGGRKLKIENEQSSRLGKGELQSVGGGVSGGRIGNDQLLTSDLCCVVCMCGYWM